MSPDDPRHGENRGYVAGCRELCCRRAHMREIKRYRLRPKRLVPATGTHRRIQALVAIGWPTSQLCDRLGRDRNYLLKVLGCDVIQETTSRAIAQLYDRLSMVAPDDSPGTNGAHKRARLMASRRGWAPPLAWDDIDNDPAPSGMRDRHNNRNYDGRDLIDEATVLRILSGETLPANAAEKREAMRRWLAAGNSERSLCERMGWKDGRYVTREDAA